MPSGRGSGLDPRGHLTAPTRPGRVVQGVGYLSLLRESHHAHLLSGMGVLDPGGVLGSGVTGWRLVNALAGGTLVTAPGSG